MKRIAFLLVIAAGSAVCATAVAALPLKRLTPINACSLLRDAGLGGRSWRNQYEDVYGCSSPYKELGTGNPLANNLAYYVEGTAQGVRQVKLVLNVNVRSQAVGAHKELTKAADLLVKKILGAELPVSIRNALTTGKNSSAKLEGAAVQVLRIDWPTGKGYEVKFIVE